MVVLHVAPHPDDELLGAPATLLALRDAGHRVVCLTCSLGRPADAPRREAELLEACARARLEPRVLAPPPAPVPHRPGPARDAHEQRLAAALAAQLDELAPALVVGPSPQDRHPGHELVGRAVRAALQEAGAPARWWLWGLWGALPFPTTVVAFGPPRLAELEHALAAHAGELARNAYDRLLAGRAAAAPALLGELAFGFGGPGVAAPYAEATTELVRVGATWRLGAARLLDPAAPFVAPDGPDMRWWLDARSAADGLAAARA